MVNFLKYELICVVSYVAFIWSLCTRFADHHVTYTFWGRIRKRRVASCQPNKPCSLQARALLRVASRTMARDFTAEWTWRRNKKPTAAFTPLSCCCPWYHSKQRDNSSYVDRTKGKHFKWGSRPHVNVSSPRIDARKTSFAFLPPHLGQCLNLQNKKRQLPIALTIALTEQPKARNVFDRCNIGIVGSCLTRWMDACLLPPEEEE